jgi:hydrogenase nickel incorporation protein HypA/HybF
MGIAASMVDIIRQYVTDTQAPFVRRVHVRVGELAGVQTDSLAFCFEAIVAGTSLQSAALDIEHVPAVRACRGCGERFGDGALLATCPACGSREVPFVSGAELTVSELELDDEAEMSADDTGQVAGARR